MRIGNWVLFERIPDVEALHEAASRLDAIARESIDKLREHNDAFHVLFNERLKVCEYVNARIEEKVDIELKSINQLLEACQELAKRTDEQKDTLERIQQLLRNHLLAHNTPL